MPRRAFRLAAAAVALAATAMGTTLAPAQAALQPGQVVSATPSLTTPLVRDGRVQALAQVGNTVVLGGTFTQVSDVDGPPLPRAGVAAYDRTTGRLLPGFAPVLDGQVWALAAGPVAGTVYVAGDFTRVGTAPASRLALLDVTTGALVRGFAPPALNGTVRALTLTRGRLLVGGTFTFAGATSRRGLVSLDPVSGRLTTFATAAFTGNHNYGVRGTAGSRMPVGVVAMAVTPDGSQLVTIGNFRTVDGALHDQVARFDLSGTTARLRSDWTTRWFTAGCHTWSFDSWVRDVKFSPDGTYFVIGSTGGGNVDACDAVLRFETSSAGTDVQPTWLASTGGDSVFSLAVTSSAVYAGGHFRWFNNPLAVDVPGPGAIGRPGIAALDPASGLPLAWNPGRHPRDKGVFAILPTDAELLVGTDTEYVGNQRYRTYRLSRFPLAGGATVPARTTPALPASLGVLDGAAGLVTRSTLTTTGVGASGRVDAVTPLGALRGATVVDGDLWVAAADGTLSRRSWDGVTAGPAVTPTPWVDPTWDGVLTGVNPGETYAGRPTDVATDLRSASGMFFLGGRLHYAVGTRLLARQFEPWTGAVSPAAVQVATLPAVPVSVTWAAGSLYLSLPDGRLLRASFDGRTLGAPVTVGGPAVNGASYAGGQLVVGPGATTCPAATGWAGQYFRGPTTSSAAACRDDATLDFAWGTAAPAPGMPATNYAVRWTRTIDVTPGTYTFTVASDGGVRLVVDGRAVLDDPVLRPDGVRTASAAVPSGHAVVVLEYTHGTGAARVGLSWTRTGGRAVPGTVVNPGPRPVLR